MQNWMFSQSGEKYSITVDDTGSLVTFLNPFIDDVKTYEPIKPQLFVATPDMRIRTKLKEAYNIQYDQKLTELSELTFKIPFRIDDYLDLSDNENVEIIKEKYLIKLTFNSVEEWFVINHISDSGGDSVDEKTVSCMALPFELADKNIRNYTSDTINAEDTFNELLSETVWGIDYIDSIFLTRYRSMDIPSSTVLESIIQVAETFDALIIWNTKKRKLSLYNPKNIGQDRGMTFSYRKYLQSATKDVQTDNMVTRLKAYGKDSLTFEEISPTGQKFIEDFSYFMYPFEQDADGNVVSSSNYMSDELCKAIINYDALVESKNGLFATLLANQTTMQTELTALQNTLSVLNQDMTEILDSLDIAKSLEDTSTVAAKNIEKVNKQIEIDNQSSLIQLKQEQLTDNLTEIINLKSELSLENNFSPTLIKERSLYVYEKEWSDERITDINDLYNMAQDRMKELRTPTISVSMNIVNFFESITEYEDWDRLAIGDTIRVKHDMSKIDIKAQLTEISYDFESKDINLTITNTRNTKEQSSVLMDLIHKGASTSNTVSMNKYKWDETTNLKTDMNDFFNSAFDSTKQQIEAGVNNSVSISGRGIVISDSTDPLKQLIAQNGVLALSNDGGNTWKTAISADGVVAERLAGKMIIGEALSMENESGKFTFDKDGVVIDGASFTIKGGLREDQLDPALKLVKMDNNYANGVRIDSTNGIVVTRSDNRFKTILNATDGLLMKKSTDGENFTNVLTADVNGDLSLIGAISGSTITGSVISGSVVNCNSPTGGDAIILTAPQSNKYNTSNIAWVSGDSEVLGRMAMNGTNLTDSVFRLDITNETGTLENILELNASGNNYMKVAGDIYARDQKVLNEGAIQVQTGTVSITPVAGVPTSVNITFPVPFSGNPRIQLTPATGVPGTEVLGVGAYPVSTTGFTATITRTNANATTLMWTATWGGSR